jgi:hypothetical protein
MFYVYATKKARVPVVHFRSERAALEFCAMMFKAGAVSTSPSR